MSYTKLSKKKEPNRVLVDLINKLKKTGKALDVGAGPLIDSDFLLKSGFIVDAYDKDPESAKKATEIKNDNFTFHPELVQDAQIIEKNYDLVISFLTLPFISPSEFNFVVEKLLSAVKIDGYIVISLFGDRDDWIKNNAKMTFLSRDHAMVLFKNNFNIERFIEEDKIGLTVDGNLKKWHIFTIVARKVDPSL